MPALLIFIVYFTTALIGGAVLAYPMHILLTNWFELDFESVSNRCVLVTAIVLFVVLFRKFGFDSWREIGFSTNKKVFWKDILKGLGLGILIMSPVIAGLLITENRIIDTGFSWSFNNLFSLLIKAAAAGLLIALVEETLFRGAMLTAFQRQNSVWFAVISTSLLYALVHFLQPEIDQNPNTLNWLSGFSVLINAFLPLLTPMHYIDSFIALFLAGVLLAIIKTQTNRLALCIGIHVAWVIIIKMLKRATNPNYNSEYAFLTGSYDKVIGYLAAICITIAIVICIRMKHRPRTN